MRGDTQKTRELGGKTHPRHHPQKTPRSRRYPTEQEMIENGLDEWEFLVEQGIDIRGTVSHG